VAIDAGDNSVLPTDAEDLDGDGNTAEPIPFDGRGDSFDRVINGTVDLGAVEVQEVDPEQNPLTVTSVEDDEVSGTLRTAIALASTTPEPDTITFDPSLAGETILLSEGALTIDNSLTIEGLGAEQLTIDAGGESRVFTIDDGDDESAIAVTLEELTITGGTAEDGGGILNREDLTLSNSTVSGNSANSGGGIYNSFGDSLTLMNSTVSGNSATGSYSAGGGISNEGTATLTGSTVSGNSARLGGGISNYGTANLTGSTVSGNSALSVGGMFNSGTATLSNSTISNSTADSSGGFGGFGTTTIINSIVAIAIRNQM
jgi:hypothetical protein